MSKILICIDGSAYAENILENAVWLSKRLSASVDVLHVLKRHSDYEAEHDDHTGAIGFGARSELLEKLTKVDEERGKLDQQKGKVILDHAVDVLKDGGITDIDTLHRRGTVVDLVKELEDNFDMVVMGKRGETADLSSVFLGSNLSKVARAIHKPLFVVSSVVRPMKKFMIAYDGKASAQKAVDYVCNSPLLKDMQCHLFSVEKKEKTIDLSDAEKQLTKAGFNVVTKKQPGSSISDEITSYSQESDIDLLVAGAYSHSQFHDIFLGSTTNTLIKSCQVPLLLFR